MKGEAKKLHLIEAILKIDDETILNEIENVLSKSKTKVVKEKSFEELSGSITDEEADEWIRAIEDAEGCGHLDCLYKKLL